MLNIYIYTYADSILLNRLLYAIYAALTFDWYFLLFTITVNWVAEGILMLFELTARRFLSYFMFVRWGRGGEHEVVTGVHGEKGWRWWLLRVLTSDWWNLSRPATTFKSTHHRTVDPDQMRLHRVFAEKLQPGEASSDFQTLSRDISFSLSFPYFSL